MHMYKINYSKQIKIRSYVETEINFILIKVK